VLGQHAALLADFAERAEPLLACVAHQLVGDLVGALRRDVGRINSVRMIAPRSNVFVRWSASLSLGAESGTAKAAGDGQGWLRPLRAGPGPRVGSFSWRLFYSPLHRLLNSPTAPNLTAWGGVLLCDTMDDHAARLAGDFVIVDRSLEQEFEARLVESSTLAFRVAYSVLRQRQDAEDVAQEAFVKA